MKCYIFGRMTMEDIATIRTNWLQELENLRAERGGISRTELFAPKKYTLPNVISSAGIVLRPSFLFYFYHAFIFIIIAANCYVCFGYHDYFPLIFSVILTSLTLPFLLAETRHIAIEESSITVDKKYFLWNDIIDCRLMRYPYSKTTTASLHILSKSMGSCQFKISYYNKNKLSHYIWCYGAGKVLCATMGVEWH